MLHKAQKSCKWAFMAGHTQTHLRETQGVIAQKLVKAMKGEGALLSGSQSGGLVRGLGPSVTDSVWG